jgi:hypothetical protein
MVNPADRAISSQYSAPRRLVDELYERARERNTTVSAIVREALIEKFEREPREDDRVT